MDKSPGQYTDIELGGENSIIVEEASCDYDQPDEKGRPPVLQHLPGKHKRLHEENETEGPDTEMGGVQTQQKVSQEIQEDEINFGIEYKYCTVCNLEQPLRTKHCK